MKTKITKTKKENLLSDAMFILENEVDSYSYELEYYEVYYERFCFKVRVNQEGLLIEMDPVRDRLLGYEHSVSPSQITNKEIIEAATPEELSNLILDGLVRSCQCLETHVKYLYKRLRGEGYMVNGINTEYKQNKYCISVLFDDEDGKYRLISVETFNGSLDSWEYEEICNLDVELYTYLTDVANEMISMQEYSV